MHRLPRAPRPVAPRLPAPDPRQPAPAAAPGAPRRPTAGWWATGKLALGWLPAVLASAGCSSGNLLAEGARPPGTLSALDQHGQLRSIGAQEGQPLVVYFYPKDGTPGCTEEACAFRDAWGRYAQAGVMVFGVSGDDQDSKAEFAEAEKLPFPILADPEHRWAEAFGVGSTLGMMDRVTFLLDATGAVARVYPDVDPGVHAVEVLEDAKKLAPTGARARRPAE